jgi:hypothetical protein
MTSIFHPPPPVERSLADIAVTSVCVATVAVGALFSRKTGACGTSHYLAFQMLAGMVMSIVEEVWVSRYTSSLVSLIAYVLNVAVFSLIVRAWYRRASQDRYVLGALALTVAYLISYFYLLPTVDCP